MDSPWNSPGRNTGVGSLSLLQGIFLTQGSNLSSCGSSWEDPLEKEMATHSSILAWKSHAQRSRAGYMLSMGLLIAWGR